MEKPTNIQTVDSHAAVVCVNGPSFFNVYNNRTNERVRRRVCNYLSVCIQSASFLRSIIQYSFYIFVTFCIESLDIQSYIIYQKYSEMIHFSIDELNIIIMVNITVDDCWLCRLYTHTNCIIINRETFDDVQVCVRGI